MDLRPKQASFADRKEQANSKVLQRLKQELSFVTGYKNQDMHLSQIEKEIDK
jgi:hypothetical protein